MTDRESLLDTTVAEFMRFLHRSSPNQVGAVARLGLTLHQFRGIIIVYVEPGITTSDFADAIGVQPSVATGVVQRLVARDLVRRELDADDRRVRRLYLTDQGNEVAEEAAGIARSARRTQLSALDDGQLEQLRELLRVLDSGLDRA
ncbi:MarR family winged helix-turn-helix transcriptional regulator [Demequina sp. NBRC 110052]|uniref:MarR family winged helix-turn-helix transcriptional regulator n=1 Tax=Demequina sp. NBRC 110052 TaxID=1570341 RepID=UPI00117F6383|nr:MarR family winged helix-turn-helix transcriptional regulator [Demequina sp. NBRC 110052]